MSCSTSVRGCLPVLLIVIVGANANTAQPFSKRRAFCRSVWPQSLDGQGYATPVRDCLGIPPLVTYLSMGGGMLPLPVIGWAFRPLSRVAIRAPYSGRHARVTRVRSNILRTIKTTRVRGNIPRTIKAAMSMGRGMLPLPAIPWAFCSLITYRNPRALQRAARPGNSGPE